MIISLPNNLNATEIIQTEKRFWNFDLYWIVDGFDSVLRKCAVHFNSDFNCHWSKLNQCGCHEPYWKSRPLILTGGTSPPHLFVDKTKKKIIGGAFYRQFKVYMKKLQIKLLRFKYSKSLSKAVKATGKGKADMAIAGLSITESRAKFADFVSPMKVRATRIWYVWPKPVDSLTTLFAVFDEFVWSAVAITLICLVVSLQLFDVGLYVSASRPLEIHDLFVNTSLAWVAMVYEALPVKWFKVERVPRALLLWMWLPTGFLLGLFYKCNLNATLIAIEYEKPVDSPRDLIDRGIPISVAFKLHL